MVVVTREIREGWLLLTVETEAYGDSKSKYGRGPSLVGLLGSLCQFKKFLSCRGLSSQNSLYTFSIRLTRLLDRQSCRAAYLLICVSGSNKF
jgi:hypothetical protein